MPRFFKKFWMNKKEKSSPSHMNRNLTRIGVFYDGNYFTHVSNYYCYEHTKKARISIAGLHNFIKASIAKAEGKSEKLCEVVAAHYFRGRQSAQDAQAKNALFKDRSFEDVLIKEGITTHFLPLSPEGEKGIDVWFALEAYELALNNRFEVCALVAADGDFIPLIKKIKSIGKKVMVLGWNFEYVDSNGNSKTTKTAQQLLECATYPFIMNEIIDECILLNSVVVDNMFLKDKRKSPPSIKNSESDIPQSDVQIGKIIKTIDGYGFIRPENGGEGIFFHNSDLINNDINDLSVEDIVTFNAGTNQRGACAKNVQLRSKAQKIIRFDKSTQSQDST